MNYVKGEGHSAAQCSNLIVKYFNSHAIDYELSIILECMVYQIHRSVAIKVIDLHAQLIERAGRVELVPARVSLQRLL